MINSPSMIKTSLLAGYHDNRVQRSLDKLLDPAIGILRELREVPRLASDPNFFHYAGKACDTFALSSHTSFYNSGGASISRELAIYKAIGEAIERYSSALYEVEDCPLSSFRDAPFACAAPHTFSLYAPAQYDDESFLFVPFDEQTPVRWTASTELVSGQSVHIPAAAVYMPYTYILGAGDAPVMQPISTGLACHRTLPEAIISGICEVVERDAVMLVWQAMLSCPQIRIETLSDLNYDIVKRLEHNGSKVYMFDITMDHGIPTILSVLSGENNPALPGYVFAGAADPDPEKAVRKSLEEIPHTRRYCSRIMQYSPSFAPQFPDHDNVKDQEHHLHFYCDHDNRQFARFLFQHKKRKSFDEIVSLKRDRLADTLQQLVQAIHQTGERVYVKELTTPDVGAAGFHVVRAVIPGYQRLCMGYKNRSLGGARLREMAGRMKLDSHLPAGAADNPAPHPYP